MRFYLIKKPKHHSKILSDQIFAFCVAHRINHIASPIYIFSSKFDLPTLFRRHRSFFFGSTRKERKKKNLIDESSAMKLYGCVEYTKQESVSVVTAAIANFYLQTKFHTIQSHANNDQRLKIKKLHFSTSSLHRQRHNLHFPP